MYFPRAQPGFFVMACLSKKGRTSSRRNGRTSHLLIQKPIFKNSNMSSHAICLDILIVTSG